MTRMLRNTVVLGALSLCGAAPAAAALCTTATRACTEWVMLAGHNARCLCTSDAALSLVFPR
jgi:hypothetical protein